MIDRTKLSLAVVYSVLKFDFVASPKVSWEVVDGLGRGSLNLDFCAKYPIAMLGITSRHVRGSQLHPVS